MATNLDRFKTDLDDLLKLGRRLEWAMTLEIDPERFKVEVKKVHGKDADAFLKDVD
jgi:hypothetical protein